MFRIASAPFCLISGAFAVPPLLNNTMTTRNRGAKNSNLKFELGSADLGIWGSGDRGSADLRIECGWSCNGRVSVAAAALQAK